MRNAGSASTTSLSQQSTDIIFASSNRNRIDSPVDVWIGVVSDDGKLRIFGGGGVSLPEYVCAHRRRGIDTETKLSRDPTLRRYRTAEE